MLWAAILFIWELVGIDLEKAKEAGGNAAALINSIKSPQAVPWALLILVVYFLFKVTIEWYQSNKTRRDTRVAKVDFFSAWVVSFMAIALYIVQTISKIQFANSLQNSNRARGIFFGWFSAFTLTLGFHIRVKYLLYRNYRVQRFPAIVLLTILLGLLGISAIIRLDWLGLSIGMPAGLASAWLLVLIPGYVLSFLDPPPHLPKK
jgi:hypothetical protein